MRARQIILVDDRGKERASLVSDNAGSVFLVMSDRTGKARVNLSVGNDGPALMFLDPSGQARTILGSTSAAPSHVYDDGIAELCNRRSQKVPPDVKAAWDLGFGGNIGRRNSMGCDSPLDKLRNL